jgi:hypothetical protein
MHSDPTSSASRRQFNVKYGIATSESPAPIGHTRSHSESGKYNSEARAGGYH